MSEVPKPRLTLGRSQRLTHQRDFQRLARTAPSAADERLVVYVAENGLGSRRVGLSVGKRIGGAVQRNRVKRLLREAFRLVQHELPPVIDLLLVAKPASGASLADYQNSLRALVPRAYRRLRKRSC